MIESWKQSVLALVLVIDAILVGGVLQAWSLEHGPAAPVPGVFGNPVRVVLEPLGAAAARMFTNPQAALAYASSGAGFDVSAPAYLPPGYALVEIDIPPKPPAASADPSRTAVLTSRNGQASFAIVEVDRNNSFRRDFVGQVIALPSVDSQVLKDGNSEGFTYHLVAPMRGADLIISRNQLSDDEVARILSSMPLLLIPGPTSTCLNNLLPPPGPDEQQDPWLRARAMLPPDVPVLRPTVLPAGLGAPILDEACVGPLPAMGRGEVPRYTVVYPGSGNESLAFILTMGAGAMGNFPGPATGQDFTVRGNSSGFLVTANPSPTNFPGLTAFALTWGEQGLIYEVRMTSTGRLTRDDLVKAAESLVPVP